MDDKIELRGLLPHVSERFDGLPVPDNFSDNVTDISAFFHAANRILIKRLRTASQNNRNTSIWHMSQDTLQPGSMALNDALDLIIAAWGLKEQVLRNGRWCPTLIPIEHHISIIETEELLTTLVSADISGAILPYMMARQFLSFVLTNRIPADGIWATEDPHTDEPKALCTEGHCPIWKPHCAGVFRFRNEPVSETNQQRLDDLELSDVFGRPGHKDQSRIFSHGLVELRNKFKAGMLPCLPACLQEKKTLRKHV